MARTFATQPLRHNSCGLALALFLAGTVLIGTKCYSQTPGKTPQARTADTPSRVNVLVALPYPPTATAVKRKPPQTSGHLKVVVKPAKKALTVGTTRVSTKGAAKHPLPPPAIDPFRTERQRMVASVCLGIQAFQKAYDANPDVTDEDKVNVSYLEYNKNDGRASQPVDSEHPLWPELGKLHVPFLVEISWRKPDEELQYHLHFYFDDDSRVTGTLPLAEAIRTPDRSTIPPDLILGPVYTSTALAIRKHVNPTTGKPQNWFIPPVDPTEYRAPFLTSSATATDLTFKKDSPNGSRYLYRFIAPDIRLVRRLAAEVASGLSKSATVPSKTVVVLHDEEPYASLLYAEFRDELKARNEYSHVTPLSYKRGSSGKVTTYLAGLKRQQALTHSATVQESGKAPQVDAPDEDIATIVSSLTSIQPDRVGIFGEIEDKLPLIQLIRAQLPDALIFTTDADESYENIVEQRLLIASMIDPHGELDSDRINAARELLTSHNQDKQIKTLRPDVYMVQGSRATEFVIHLTERLLQTDYLARYKVNKPLASPLLPLLLQHRRGLLFRTTDRPVPNVVFDGNGDLSESVAPTNLLVVRRHHLESLDQRRYPRAWLLLLDFENPLCWLVWLYVFIVFLIIAKWTARKFRWPLPALLAHLRQQRDQARELSQRVVEAGFRPLWYERFFGDNDLPSFVRYQVPSLILFGAFIAVAARERTESISIFPNGYSVCPTLEIRLFLVGLCLWWIANWRIRMGEIHAQLEEWDLKDVAKDLRSFVANVFYPAKSDYVLVVLAVALTSWVEHFFPAPITGARTAAAYASISLVIQAVFFFTAIMAYRMGRVSNFLSSSFPIGTDLHRMHRRFRVLISPFVDMTYVTIVVYVGFVVARSSWIDHWLWSPFLCFLYTVVFCVLYWILYDIHLGWRDKMLEAKRVLDHDNKPLEEQTEEEKELRAQLQDVPDWAWDARGPMRVVIAVSVPVATALLQGGPALSGLLQAIPHVFDR